MSNERCTYVCFLFVSLFMFVSLFVCYQINKRNVANMSNERCMQLIGRDSDVVSLKVYTPPDNQTPPDRVSTGTLAREARSSSGGGGGGGGGGGEGGGGAGRRLASNSASESLETLTKLGK